VKALRIVLHQASANYKKEETVENKMTYPLPPISTIIGALHNACGYTSYHPMKISIQGRYESMHKEPYTDYCFLNSTMDDRGILVKMKNEYLLSNAYDKVASAKNSQGNSFRNNVTIQVYNQVLLDEFQQLKILNDRIEEYKKRKMNPILSKIKRHIKTLADRKSTLDKGSNEYKKLVLREKEIKSFEKLIKDKVKEYEQINYSKPISKFRSLITSIKYYEVLDEVSLVIHVQADERTLEDILEHIYDLKSIGRSEDFVNVIEIESVELEENISGKDIISEYSAYVDMNLVRDQTIMTRSNDEYREIIGTKYNLNSEYKIINSKRVFDKKKVMYVSKHCIDHTDSKSYLFLDNKYIVNLL
jgi:CRISPR-associated protein Cas5t